MSQLLSRRTSNQRRISQNLMEYVLRVPSYGWKNDDGSLVVPRKRQIFAEFWSRLNVFKSRKNWLAFFNWTKILLLAPCLFIFIFHYFSFSLAGIAFLYSMVIMGTHGTIWYHRYCTHNAYTFRNKFWRFLTRNLTINIIPEETYVISHHVHHALSDQPGDPYNASAGFWYCFLADVNHQAIAEDLAEPEYARVVRLMAHSGIKANSYRQYQKWASIAKPARTIAGCILNWAFWVVIFCAIGGPALVFALFGAAAFWAIGVRTFNYEGHGKGKVRHRDGVDYNREDLSINQIWPGYVAGEWHNNHHLYPSSARSGFLRYQLDLAWCYVKLMKTIGAVSSYHDSKKTFLEQYRPTARTQRSKGMSS